MLRLALNFLAAFLLFRAFRGWMRPRPAPRRPRPEGRGLDPDRAVAARWSEIPEEGDGSG